MASYADKVLRQAVAHHQAGRLADAEPLYRQAASVEPTNPDVLAALGRFLTPTGRAPEAVDLLARAHAFRPADAGLMLDLSEACRHAARLGDAIDWLRRATRADPGLVDAHNNLAALLLMTGRDADAEAPLLVALRLRPEHPDALHNLANLRAHQGRAGDAIACYRRLLASHPHHPAAWANLAITLQDAGLAADALDAFERAVTLAPHDPTPWDNYLLALNRTPGLDPADVAGAHRQYGRLLIDPLQPYRRPHPNPPDPGRPLRVGYVSADLRRHSVACFLEPLLAHHDPARFHVTCYSSAVAPDDVTARLRARAGAWRDVASLHDGQLADLVRADAIDLLVDLSGHTQGNRLQTFGLAPAPVQLTYLGYPNTTGVAPIGYRLTDARADPPGATDAWHTERLVRLDPCAWCYAPPADAPPVGVRPPGAPLTFGSFSAFSKVSDPTVAVWSAVLRAVPGSRLLLKARPLSDEFTRQTTLRRFADHGIPADRLDLVGWDPSPADHLAAYHRVDVALDTFPYHGTTTTCEALLMGVPVVTLAGRAHAARVGVSLLAAAGLPDLVASSPDQFTAIAAALAQDRPRLASLRARLRDQLLASPLCDAPAFARGVEHAYRTLWAAWCAAQSPSPR